MPGQRFQSWGFRDHPLLTATVNASGIAIAQTDEVAAKHQWQVDSMVVWSTSALVGPARVYVTSDTTSLLPQFYRNGTAVGNSDTWEPAGERLIVPAGRVLAFQWSGLTPGAECFAQVHYEEQAIELVSVDSTIVDWGG